MFSSQKLIPIVSAVVLLAAVGWLAWSFAGNGTVGESARAAAATPSTDATPSPAPGPPPGPAPEGMAWIPGGAFEMGSADNAPDERPVHRVQLDGFWMSKTEVTNAQFAQFVKDTGYVTTAEKPMDPAQFPGVPAERLKPASMVFTKSPRPIPLNNPLRWWRLVPGTDWRHPQGPDSTIADKMDHPVVQVSWDDAHAYAKWAGGRLPTEAQWEYAARGGLKHKPYVWGDQQTPGGHWEANIWQGKFPVTNTAADGFTRTAPVASFPANGYGLFDMSGNVWEWTADWYRPDYYSISPTRNPRGPDSSFDPQEPGVPKRVTRGGSFLCNDVYCKGYMPATRMKCSPDTALNHTGFRLVKRP